MDTGVDGAWDCTAETPMGEQRFTLTVARAGDGFSGRAAGKLGAMAITDGTVEGDTLVWTMRVTTPLPVTLDCRAEIAGDRLEGRVRAGFMGSYRIAGVRAG